GACRSVRVDVRGGVQPYSFEWSDAALQGPGPQSVCGSDATELEVTVTDSGSGDSEFAVPPAHASAKLSVAPCNLPTVRRPDVCESVSGFDGFALALEW